MFEMIWENKQGMLVRMQIGTATMVNSMEVLLKPKNRVTVILQSTPGHIYRKKKKKL